MTETARMKHLCTLSVYNFLGQWQWKRSLQMIACFKNISKTLQQKNQDNKNRLTGLK